MTKIKASVTAIHPPGTAGDQVVRRAPSMPSSIPSELEPEYRKLLHELISMPDWNNARVHLVEAYILALHAMRTCTGMQKITASNAVLRYSRALGIVRRDPVTLRPAPSHPRTLPLFPSSDSGEKAATGAARAPWSRVP
jgi:hypothetical protein